MEREFAGLARWQELRHAYGTAGDVPAILKQIADSKGMAELQGPLGELCSRVLHQGTIYSASAPAVRALIEIIPTADPADRNGFYELLSAFADSARMAIEDGPAPPSHAGGHPDDGEAIRVEFARARNLFESGLADPDPQIRELAAQILTAFRGIQPETAKLVREHYLSEENDHVRYAMLGGLSRVHEAIGDWPQFLDVALARESEPKNRFLVRSAQVMELGPNLDQTIVDDLVTCFVLVSGKNPYAFSKDRRFYEALRRLRPDRELAAMIRALDLGNGERLLRVLAERLLRLVFADHRTGWGRTAISRAKGLQNVEYWGLDGAAPEIPAKLDETQQSVLIALAAKQELWEFRTNLWALFNLPDHPEDLHRFVREH